jgi:hypothetical protein
MFTGRRAHTTGDVASGNPVTFDSASRKMCGKGGQRASQSDGAMLRCGLVFELASTHATKCWPGKRNLCNCHFTSHHSHLGMGADDDDTDSDRILCGFCPSAGLAEIIIPGHSPSTIGCVQNMAQAWCLHNLVPRAVDGACHNHTLLITNQLESGSVQSRSKHVLTATLHPVRLGRVAHCSRTNRPASKPAAI